MQHVVVSEYNELWKDMFEREARVIRGILRDNCVAIYHIGSTSVDRLAAKPIIDILVVVHCLADVDSVSLEFQEIGYEYMGEFGIEGRRYLRKGGDERTHQIHVFDECCHDEIERHLAFRDYLREHDEVCQQYAMLKKKLALMFPYDIEKYCDGKDQFVKRVEQDALQWKKDKIKRL